MNYHARDIENIIPIRKNHTSIICHMQMQLDGQVIDGAKDKPAGDGEVTSIL